MDEDLCHFPGSVAGVSVGDEVSAEFLRHVLPADTPVTDHTVKGGGARLAVVLPGVGLEPPAVTELDSAGLTAENKNLRWPRPANPHWSTIPGPPTEVSGSLSSRRFLVLSG